MLEFLYGVYNVSVSNFLTEVDVCLKTNYAGFVAWGEYPLCFAAVLDQEECYRLILNKGANHDLQDSNGNTVAHIMVIYDNMRMFDIAVQCGAAINILNNQQLTPLSTASFLARTEMFFHIDFVGKASIANIAFIRFLVFHGVMQCVHSRFALL